MNILAHAKIDVISLLSNSKVSLTFFFTKIKKKKIVILNTVI